MKNKSTRFEELLKKFALSASALVLVNSAADAQVIVTDPIDDTLKVGDVYNLDLNNDGRIDFKLKPGSYKISQAGSTSVTYFTTYYFYKISFQTNNQFVKDLNNKNFVEALNSDTLLKTNANFGTNTGFNLFYYVLNSGELATAKGNFSPGEDHFIGVKFVDDQGKQYLGWIQIQIVGKINGKYQKEMIIKKYAYEQTADSIYLGTKPFMLQTLDTTSSSATIGIKPKFTGRVVYVLLDATAKAPTWDQVLQGTDSLGNPAFQFDSVEVTGITDTTFINLQNLESSHSYVLYLVQKDEQGDVVKEVYAVPFTTKEQIPAGISSLEASKIALYPNPARDFVTLTGVRSGVEYEIYDLSGKKVKQGRIEASKKVDLSGLKAGVYTVVLTDGQMNIRKKLIKY